MELEYYRRWAEEIIPVGSRLKEYKNDHRERQGKEAAVIGFYPSFILCEVGGKSGSYKIAILYFDAYRLYYGDID